MSEKKPPKKDTIVIEPTDSQRNIAALCYIFFAIGYFTREKDSTYVKFHMQQSLALLVIAVLLTFVNIIPIFGWIVSFVGSIAVIVIFFIGIGNALGGRQQKLPFIGDFADNFKL
jgi:uncharacterized membrane protein